MEEQNQPQNINQEIMRKQAEEMQMYKEFGLDMNELGKPCETIEELLTRDTGMVLAEAIDSFSLGHKDKNIPAFKAAKGDVYVMTLGEFNNLKEMNNKKLFKPSKIKFKNCFRRYRGEDLCNSKLLIWRFGGLGDLLHIQSLVKYLKFLYPTCEINFATGPQNVLMFHSYPKGLLDKCLTMPFSKEALDYHDYHLTFINSIENCEEKRFRSHFDIFKKVANLEFNIEDFLPELVPIPQLVEKVERYIPDKTVCIHMRSTSPIRSLSMSVWRNIMLDILDMGYNIGIIDDLTQMESINKLIDVFGFDKSRVLNFSQMSLDPNYAIAIISKCIGFIGIDSGPTHMAAALSKPTVGFYGGFPSLAITGHHYKTMKYIDTPENWNICGMYPCYMNNKVERCPYVAFGQNPGCSEMMDHSLVAKYLHELIQN